MCFRILECFPHLSRLFAQNDEVIYKADADNPPVVELLVKIVEQDIAEQGGKRRALSDTFFIGRK